MMSLGALHTLLDAFERGEDPHTIFAAPLDEAQCRQASLLVEGLPEKERKHLQARLGKLLEGIERYRKELEYRMMDISREIAASRKAANGNTAYLKMVKMNKTKH